MGRGTSGQYGSSESFTSSSPPLAEYESSSCSRRIVPSARDVQWTNVPDCVRYVPGVIAAVIDFLPDQLLEEHPSGGDPAVFGIGREAVAVAERAVMGDESTDPAARARREMSRIAAFEVNDCRHGRLP